MTDIKARAHTHTMTDIKTYTDTPLVMTMMIMTAVMQHEVTAVGETRQTVQRFHKGQGADQIKLSAKRNARAERLHVIQRLID